MTFSTFFSHQQHAGNAKIIALLKECSKDLKDVSLSNTNYSCKCSCIQTLSKRCFTADEQGQIIRACSQACQWRGVCLWQERVSKAKENVHRRRHQKITNWWHPWVNLIIKGSNWTVLYCVNIFMCAMVVDTAGDYSRIMSKSSYSQKFSN